MQSTTTAGKVIGRKDTTTSPTDDLEENAPQINQDDKFYRLLSKESSAANPSLGGYYRVAPAAVPFSWESAPGTPKNTVPASSAPPLTPPPSYQLRLNKPRSAGSKKQLGFLSFAVPGGSKPHGRWYSSSSDNSSTVSPTRRRHGRSLSSDIPLSGSTLWFGIQRLKCFRGE